MKIVEALLPVGGGIVIVAGITLGSRAPSPERYSKASAGYSIANFHALM